MRTTEVVVVVVATDTTSASEMTKTTETGERDERTIDDVASAMTDNVDVHDEARQTTELAVEISLTEWREIPGQPSPFQVTDSQG